MTLKSELGVIQGHWKWHHIQYIYEYLLAFHSNHGPMLYHFRDKARYW